MGAPKTESKDTKTAVIAMGYKHSFNQAIWTRYIF